MGGIEILHSEGLIWVMRYPETFRVGDYRQLFADARQLNPESRKHAVLVDISRVNPLSISAASRQESTVVLQENAEFLAATCLAEARVAPNPLVRGMLTVFDWAASNPWPINNLYSGEAAELWVRGQLAKMGKHVPIAPVWPPRAPQYPEPA